VTNSVDGVNGGGIHGAGGTTLTITTAGGGASQAAMRRPFC
jgi:hypothetical protein